MALKETVQLIIKANDTASRTLSKVEGTLKKMGISARGLATAFAAVSAAAVGIGFLGTKLFDLGSAVGETRSKFETTFGAAQASVDQFLDTFATKAGITRRVAQELTATTGAMAQGMGQTAARAAETAIQVARLGGDIASFNNLAGGTAEGIEIINSGLTGEFERLKRVGIVVKAAEVDKRALTLTGKNLVKQLTEEDRIMARLQLITERAGVAMGDLARTSDSSANRARALKARWQDIIDDFAVKLMPTLESFLGMIEDMVPALAKVADKLAEVANLTFLAFGGEDIAFQRERLALSRLPEDQLAGRVDQLRGELQSKRFRRLTLEAAAAVPGGLTREQAASIGIEQPGRGGPEVARALADVKNEIESLTRALDFAEDRLARFNRTVAETPGGGAASVGGGPGVGDVARGTPLVQQLPMRLRPIRTFDIPALPLGEKGFGQDEADKAKIFRDTMEANAQVSERLRIEKERELQATANMVMGLAGAAAALIGIIRGTRGGGFFGVLGAGLALAGGFAATLATAGAASPLLAASLTAGGALLGAATSGSRVTPVSVVNPRDIGQAIRDIQGPLRVTNQLIAPSTGVVLREIEFELDRRTRLGKQTPVPFGSSFGG